MICADPSPTVNDVTMPVPAAPVNSERAPLAVAGLGLVAAAAGFLAATRAQGTFRAPEADQVVTADIATAAPALLWIGLAFLGGVLVLTGAARAAGLGLVAGVGLGGAGHLLGYVVVLARAEDPEQLLDRTGTWLVVAALGTALVAGLAAVRAAGKAPWSPSACVVGIGVVAALTVRRAAAHDTPLSALLPEPSDTIAPWLVLLALSGAVLAAVVCAALPSRPGRVGAAVGLLVAPLTWLARDLARYRDSGPALTELLRPGLITTGVLLALAGILAVGTGLAGGPGPGDDAGRDNLGTAPGVFGLLAFVAAAATLASPDARGAVPVAWVLAAGLGAALGLRRHPSTPWLLAGLVLAPAWDVVLLAVTVGGAQPWTAYAALVAVLAAGLGAVAGIRRTTTARPRPGWTALGAAAAGIGTGLGIRVGPTLGGPVPVLPPGLLDVGIAAVLGAAVGFAVLTASRRSAYAVLGLLTAAGLLQAGRAVQVLTGFGSGVGEGAAAAESLTGITIIGLAALTVVAAVAVRPRAVAPAREPAR